MHLLETDVLARLAGDLGAAAWLLDAEDPLRGYFDMLGHLPADADAWYEVLVPWVDEARRGRGPECEDRGRIAAMGAAGVAALSAARELPHEPQLASALRALARWCFFLVRADAR